GQLLLVLVERSDDMHVWHRLGDNRVLPWVAAGTLGLLAVIVLVPPVASSIHLASPSVAGWVLAIVVAATSTLWGEFAKHDIRSDD
ncbi:MAG: cation-translocating P-type ATPase C-terminal domain-containing protein, partial [Candidatus Limnocylindria bacterium]|nr:cation-translocating P-type ATPase C-terminal domain-containing protein [Candidatus Limnocylindria bacterium]